MNFLIYMLGRAQRLAITRPLGRDALIGAAAVHAAAGHLDGALAAYRKLTEMPRCGALDMLIRGHLHLALEQSDEARDCFARGMGRLLESNGTNTHETRVERLVAKGDHLLGLGRYDAATLALRKARTLIDLLLSAEAGLVVAQGDSWKGAFASLTGFNDLTLRMLARIELARQLAVALKQRQLSAHLAAWATSDKSVDDLLTRESGRLAALSAQSPAHAETAYRLGLVASALGKLDSSARAFGQVLRTHPHHMISAVHLATDLREIDAKCDCMGILRRAFGVPRATLTLFAEFSAAAADQAFDSAAARFGEASDGADVVRANLAFALSELGLLDEARESWREPTPQIV